jgi:hypothetical protein
MEKPDTPWAHPAFPVFVELPEPASDQAGVG